MFKTVLIVFNDSNLFLVSCTSKVQNVKKAVLHKKRLFTVKLSTVINKDKLCLTK